MSRGSGEGADRVLHLGSNARELLGALADLLAQLRAELGLLLEQVGEGATNFVGDAQLLKDGFNVLLDELKARGGTKDLGGDVKNTVRKTRELIVWLMQGVAAGSGKKWSGAERRQATTGVDPSRRGN